MARPVLNYSRPLECSVIDSGMSIASSLEDSVLRCLQGNPTPSLLFSGGIDSSLLAWILKSRGLKAELVTVSLEGGADATTAEESARLMALECNVHFASTEEILKLARGLREQSPGLSLNDVAIQTAMRAAITKAANGTIMCARGADELFLGYAHMKGLRGKDLAVRAEGDLRKLTENDWPLMMEFSASLGKVLVAPFLETSFMNFVSTIPWEARVSDTENKWLLRQAARELGLPQDIVNRPKKGFQYGSGIYKELKKSL